ncbi:MAG: M16 family metallopeptidase [Candidatus Kariarchaeaceae archaeon]|jgi:predicted Zn-dependent peptidase
MITQEVRKLNNGVPVLLVQYPGSKSATIGVSFNVGGRNEWGRSPEFNGISHFLEHQFFKGDEARGLTSLKVSQKLDDLGGLINAFTWKQVTCYFTKTLNTEIENAIDLWADLLTFGQISQEEFDKESFVVRQEFNMRKQDNPFFFLFSEISTQLHQGTSLEMDVIGTEEALSSVTLKQMEDYRYEHYDLSNAALMVLGNFDFDKIFDRLNSTFGSRAVRDIKPSYKLVEFQLPQENVMSMYRYDKPSPLTLIGVGIKTPGAKSEDMSAMEILNSYLSLGRSSLAQQKLVRSGLTAFANVGTSTYEDIGELVVLVGAPPAMTQQAHNALFEMLYEALTMDITEELLGSICDQIEFSRRRSREDPLQVMQQQAFDIWDLGEFISLEDYMQKLRNVTVNNYNHVRNKILKNLKGVYLMMGTIPEDFHPSFPEGTWSGRFE